MTFNFERYTQTGLKASKPRISIRKHGVIAFSRGAVSKYELGTKYPAIVLFFDTENATIGIKPVAGKDEQGAISLRLHKGRNDTDGSRTTASVKVRAFLEHYSIMHERAKSYDVTWNDEYQMLLAVLTPNHASPAS